MASLNASEWSNSNARWLDHRVKNALATVSAVVAHSQNGSDAIADFVTTLNGRIRHFWHNAEGFGIAAIVSVS